MLPLVLWGSGTVLGAHLLWASRSTNSFQQLHSLPLLPLFPGRFAIPACFGRRLLLYLSRLGPRHPQSPTEGHPNLLWLPSPGPTWMLSDLLVELMVGIRSGTFLLLCVCAECITLVPHQTLRFGSNTGNK